MKKLIVSGDSCTEPYFYSSLHPSMDFDFPKWPDHVGKHLGMEVINLARGGAGNEFIYSSIQDVIMQIPKEEIGFVIAGWSQSHREDWEEGVQDHYPYKHFAKSPWFSRRIAKSGKLYTWVKKSLRTYIAFQNLCENNNLPYFHFQMGDIFENYLNGLGPTENEAIKGIDYRKKYEGDFRSTLEDILDLLFKYDPYIKNFIGWPGISQDFQLRILGDNIKRSLNHRQGFTMHSHIIGQNLRKRMKKDLSISELDDHPNGKGHKAIADFIINSSILKGR
jgi:hypothetical protein|tara:strand:+ start:1325 stop:2158 length:834 start_codon:yes stop_codon:yes gene_type:complete